MSNLLQNEFMKYKNKNSEIMYKFVKKYSDENSAFYRERCFAVLYEYRILIYIRNLGLSIGAIGALKRNNTFLFFNKFYL